MIIKFYLATATLLFFASGILISASAEPADGGNERGTIGSPFVGICKQLIYQRTMSLRAVFRAEKFRLAAGTYVPGIRVSKRAEEHVGQHRVRVCRTCVMKYAWILETSPYV